MKFFVTYSVYKYDGEIKLEFNTIEDVTNFLNQHASNPDFVFEVIHGTRIEFEPTEMIKAYRLKDNK